MKSKLIMQLLLAIALNATFGTACDGQEMKSDTLNFCCTSEQADEFIKARIEAPLYKKLYDSTASALEDLQQTITDDSFLLYQYKVKSDTCDLLQAYWKSRHDLEKQQKEKVEKGNFWLRTLIGGLSAALVFEWIRRRE